MSEQAETIEWGYAGAGAPERWADLSADYAACAEGASQSPIDIVEAPALAGTPPPSFDYGGRSTEIARSRHSVQTHFDERNTLRSAAPAARGDVEQNFELVGRDFQPGGASCYAYDGSLTTPPCAEGVAWFVMRERRTVSSEQLAALSEIVGGENNRPVQPLNGRSVALLW